MNELVKLVEEWAKEKRLDKAEPEKQMLKVIEEVGEVGAALARNNENDLRDGIGDMVVTLPYKSASLTNTPFTISPWRFLISLYA
jgi:NTP pyrophosphatase (non-canonical NTP hydrolase)